MQDRTEQPEHIVEQLPYLNELMTAIRQVNDSILQGKDARDAAENLLTDLPEDWRAELNDATEIENEKYNKVLNANNKYLITGSTPSQKYKAQNAIYIAGKEYARNIKKITITLLKQKDLLFKTRKKVEEASLSIWKLGEGDDGKDMD